MGGGAESMSRSQYWLPSMRLGQRMNDGQVIDAMFGVLSDQFDSCHMGVTAENVASRFCSSGYQRNDRLAIQLMNDIASKDWGIIFTWIGKNAIWVADGIQNT